MNNTSEHTHEEGSVIAHEELVTTLDRPPLLSWGAIAGGLVFVIAISWLLNLLGMAIGASIADASDGDAMTNGLTTGAMVWMVLSWLIAFFVGALLTARLSGKVDSTAGMLHGMTLWALATALMLILGYWGVKGLLQTGQSVLETTVSSATSAASAMIPSAETVSETIPNAMESKLADNIKARLKRRAASIVARADAEGGAEVRADEVRQAIEQLDSSTLQQIATHIAMGEMTSAREQLVSATNLSDREVREIVTGLENEFEEQLNLDDNDTELVGDISNALERQVADFVATLDSKGGPEVTQSEVRNALSQMDRDTMRVVSMRLLNGEAQAAKDALAANTNLTTREINDIVEGVNDDISRTVDKYREQVNEAVEVASTYAQAVLWTVFVAATMALAVSLLGGWLGAESSRKIELELRRKV